LDKVYSILVDNLPFLIRIAGHNKTSSKTLRKLAKDSRIKVRWEVYKNENTPNVIKNNLKLQDDIKDCIKKEKEGKIKTEKWLERWHRRG